MEKGGSSNIEYKYTRRARTSGIVLREGGAARSAATATNAANIAGVPLNVVAEEVNQQQQGFKRDADEYMPIANITRILRRVLPTHAKVADDAKEAIQECISEFISFITTEANRRCRHDYRTTVTPEDVLAAMASLGFDDYLESLTVFLNKHRTQQDPERGSRNQLSQFVRREGGIGVGFLHHQQLQGAPTVRPPPPPPPPQAASTMGYYVPLPPPVAATMEDEEEFGGMPKVTNEFGGGEEFDPFQ
ncbi:hypothetical protein ACP275_05G077800 [Erythranthe tilingii]